MPVPGAEVRVSFGDKVASGRTDSIGVFRVEGLIVGEWRASVRRIGFRETSVDLHLWAGDNIYAIEVDETPASLTDVEVVAPRVGSIRLRDFEARVARGAPNSVVTRKDIVKRNPVYLSQLLRGMSGIQVTERGGSRIAVTSRGSVPGKGMMVACELRMSVDGMLRPPLTDLDEIIPNDVHGVEVYFGPARLPQQLANFRTDNWCGLVAIWTRDR
ncbi:MAG: TonB-dependent receptor [Phycisphaerae bacterium]|nr:TonB-dependent receptor [Gemmatimonadaceae bacterium]